MVDFLVIHAAWLWLAVAVVCLVVEALTFSLTTVWFACGAFVMVLLSALRLPLALQLLVFAAVSCALLAFTRRLVLRRLSARRTATNSDRLIGRKALVTARITALEKGAVKINGIEWSAKTADGVEIPAGTQCQITAIEGATLLVQPALPVD